VRSMVREVSDEEFESGDVELRRYSVPRKQTLREPMYDLLPGAFAGGHALSVCGSSPTEASCITQRMGLCGLMSLGTMPRCYSCHPPHTH
jgi:hypothetical protein